MKGAEQFEEFHQRLSVLDEEVREAVLNYAVSFYQDRNCTKEEALEMGIAKAELEKRNL
ncbi:hypothetical protein HC174_12180 [Salinimicrobium sp. CDJ15-81-2]|jgi:hypothetical protein|uniref:Uncharacterized protein n=3 Tax=Flavobacteriaceae TaxID=49546 RepID=A0A9X3I106_9FLAO|nr:MULTISPECIES: hypothetical protein [Flavobacteriaceae]MDX1601850.1 hypothetical protein [Salinimicrobium sediminis]NJY63504.1 hypothetical protein [Salinimicrobium nanhaiense]MCX2838431.1 hypothetical protein [Salinimicrobium profundisediminis]MDT0647092.1 hypothetical protein [Zunongwangia sp. F260]NJW52171.1 hypothetical protein [Salinimicrobium oceani]